MQNLKDNLIKFYAFFSMFVVIIVVFSIFYFIFSRGISKINLDFFIQNPSGVTLGDEGGIRDAILGSFLLMILSMILSGIFGVSCAIYRQIYCSSKFLSLAIKFVIQSIASIPSILLGLFVYGFFIVTLSVPKSLLTASTTLALMVFPFVEISVEKSIKEIDKKIIRDSFALGVDKTYMCQNLILPVIKRKILSILILAGSYAVGATAPILLTGVVFMATPSGLLSPVMALPFHLHMILNQSVGSQNAYATALVLILVLIVLHILSSFIVSGLGEKIVKYFNNKKS